MDGKLVAPADTDSDNDDEIGEAGKKVIDMLRKRDSEDGVKASAFSGLAPAPESGPQVPSRSSASLVGNVQERSPAAASSVSKSLGGKGGTTPSSRFKATQHMARGSQPAAASKSVQERIDEAAAVASEEMIATLTTQYRPASTRSTLSPPSVVVTSPNQTAFPSTIVESPSFAKPVTAPKVTQSGGPRPANVMSAEVKERQPSKGSSGDAPPKVSRFKANRM